MHICKSSEGSQWVPIVLEKNAKRKERGDGGRCEICCAQIGVSS